MPNLFTLKRLNNEWRRRVRAKKDGVCGPWYGWRVGAKWLD